MTQPEKFYEKQSTEPVSKRLSSKSALICSRSRKAIRLRRINHRNTWSISKIKSWAWRRNWEKWNVLKLVLQQIQGLKESMLLNIILFLSMQVCNQVNFLLWKKMGRTVSGPAHFASNYFSRHRSVRSSHHPCWAWSLPILHLYWCVLATFVAHTQV